MYYSFHCTYCGRIFYTYNSDKNHASQILYGTIKQHLIDTDEDRKEYEMDEGESIDTNQIYTEMVESKDPPAGGYEATSGTGLQTSESPSDSSQRNSPPPNSTNTSTSTHSSTAMLIAVVIALIIIFILFFATGMHETLRQFIPNQ